jgi:hypothetical protein
MTDLSPQAQSVLDAFEDAPYYPEQRDGPSIAAALRALAKQVGYDNYNVDGDHGLAVVNVRDIFAIATELESHNE